MITICANAETLRDYIDIDFDDAIRCEAGEELAYDDVRAIAGNDVEFEISTSFKEWHGGRFAEQAAMYGNRVYGLVAYQRDDERATAERIDAGIEAFLNARAADIKKSWDAADSE